ncbi:unnamed protein product [Caenorhabditis sp. 36 PRJEB53466]|nr:unnamed protein product [Caenorhabditis sp. 36 PRJEB53466]
MTWTSKHEIIKTIQVLVVGAGGIGCELLKNLAATGFRKVHVIDLDTIDISNLNRQFLFRKEHVSSSKAEIATKVVKQFCPDIDLTFEHGSIFDEKFNIDFFKSFEFVMNALDNKKARNHVNRMCLAANRPLIESGTSGFTGQVQVILRGRTECYECTTKETQKTFPGCTIRNTPSEHIHCTVWAKHVFNQLFGEIDIDDEVSPDMKAEGQNEAESEESANDSANEEPTPIGTRQWAENVKFDPAKVFDKLFLMDIEYLCRMEHLWNQRRRPKALSFSSASEDNGKAPVQFEQALKEATSIWPLSTATSVFSECVRALSAQVSAHPDLRLSFDKDVPLIMAFVAACANIRAQIFGIPTKSMFEIKAMAGNIVPAIAATNAMVAGMMVTEAMKLAHGLHELVQQSHVRLIPSIVGKVFYNETPFPPNPQCYVCSEQKEVIVYVNPSQMTVHGLCEKVLKNELNMLAPDVMDNASSRIIISSDGDTDDLLTKKLSEVSIEDGAILCCDDFQQDMTLRLFIRQQVDLTGDEFKVERTEQEKPKEPAEEKRKRKSGHEGDEPEVKKTKTDEAPEALQVINGNAMD